VKTFVALENSNCTRCHNALLGALRDRNGVQRVWSDLSTGCLVIEHKDDPDALVSLIRSEGRAVAVAANGERVMVSLDGHEATGCPVSKDAVPARSDGEAFTNTVTIPVISGAPGSIARSRPVTWSSAAAGRSDPGDGSRRDGRGGVRVLSRERPAPGVVLRSVLFVVKTFRVVFGLLSPPR
jgi:hypothetical protein